MARYRRRTVPGAVVHLISRVVDQEFRIDDAARADYLDRVARVAPRTDWQLLGYALMSNHVHWLLRCRGSPIREFIHPVHSGFGRALNRRDKRLTPVFADRPKTFLYEPQATGRILAYIHNNPVRAGVETHARDSNWTSHRAYVDASASPAWLDVEAGLSLCELDPDERGRSAFDELVRGLAHEPRDPLYGDEPMARARRALRRSLNAPVELATPAVFESGLELPFVGAESMPLQEQWPGPIDTLVAAAASALDVRLAHVRSRTRRRRVVKARRLVVLTAHRYLGRSLTEASAAVGITTSAGSRLLDGVSVELDELACEIAQRLRAPPT